MSEWPVKELGTLGDILDKLRKPITKKDRVAGSIPYYGATGVLDHVEGFIFDEPLVLLGEDGAKWGAGDNSAFAISGKTWVNNHAHVLRPNRELLIDEWLIAFLNYQDLSDFVSGMTVPKLNQGRLREIPIPVPPLAEQERIVAILDEAFEGVTTTTAHTERKLQNARDLFQSTFQATFQQKGKNWRETTLEDLGKITSSKRIFKNEYVASGVPFYRTKEIKQLANKVPVTTELFIAEARYKEICERFDIPKIGDLLLTAIGTIGEIYVVETLEPFYFKDGNVLWLKDFDEVDPYFLKFLLRSFVEDLNRLSHGSTYNALPIQRLKEHQIYLPPLPEQRAIVEKLDELSAQTRQLEALYQRQLTAYTELKQSLLHQAFSGRL